MAKEILVTANQMARLRKLAHDRRISRENFEQVLSSGNDTIADFFNAIESGVRMRSHDDQLNVQEARDYEGRVRYAGMSNEALKESLRQIGRLNRICSDSAENEVIRHYLDWMVALPWSKASPNLPDLKSARTILDKDHAHRNELKDLLLNYLAVHILRGTTSHGSILCFVGPPGVGKTSFGRSIARAMGREFVRISLGGVCDEAEIRGHRRTYVGALPGRIIQELKQAGTANPVFVLDEIDKLGSNFRGDPSSALLEALDPGQNTHFSDHYLSVPFDLSRVFFLATANRADSIHPTLRDRMEVIHLPGYTHQEKVDIARLHLVERQMERHGLARNNIRWSRNAIADMVSLYTREEGVRSLERLIATICLRAARRVVEGKISSSIVVNRRTLPSLLGPPRFQKKQSTTSAYL